MDIDIRKHIISNFRDDDIITLRNAIEESIKEKDEIALPGMGVFMEILWQDSNEEVRQEILNTLYNRIKKEPSN